MHEADMEYCEECNILICEECMEEHESHEEDEEEEKVKVD